jgi:hypothetical protein
VAFADEYVDGIVAIPDDMRAHVPPSHRCVTSAVVPDGRWDCATAIVLRVQGSENHAAVIRGLLPTKPLIPRAPSSIGRAEDF